MVDLTASWESRMDVIRAIYDFIDTTVGVLCPMIPTRPHLFRLDILALRSI